MEDYVSLELAKKLKDCGFTFKTYCYHYPYPCDMTGQYAVPAPRIDQVLKWLRNNKGFHIYAELCYTSLKSRGTENINSRWYSFCVSNIWTCEHYGDEKEYDCCEDAEIAGIEYVCNYLI